MKPAHRHATALLLASAFAVTSCTTVDPYTGEQKMSNTAGGAMIGALAGAGIGALTGSNSKRRRENALIGAGIGALSGGAIGNYMDRQESQLRAELQGTGVSVTRRGQDVILNMPGNITFATGSATITSGFYPVLDSVARVLAKYNQTLVDVAGHTDSTGGRDVNMRLSQGRAESVAGYLQRRGVDPRRMHAQGYGPDYPIASNGTTDGRQQNRRVEITLQPLRG